MLIDKAFDGFEYIVHDFDLDAVLDCGQCFRWEKVGNLWRGIVEGHYLEIEQKGNQLFFYKTTKQEIDEYWIEYFDLSTDYASIIKLLSCDCKLAEACEFAPGIRILRQPPWETLCSFILSQNNNIPRIKGLILRLSENFGHINSNGMFTFPKAETLAELDVDQLSPVRSGFRAKYILDAAKKVASGEINFEQIKQMNYLDARQELMKIKGVGPKVADCTLLFGFYRLESFPQDVWIKRATALMFPNGLPESALPFAGIAQQYIFHYARKNPDLFKETA